mmetsp:Transcript_121088/g.270346  ORF Transcript_121088/g.270346 Transcript_121088/m.270346 type:complete len:239 (+) Transcript_121088:241-957(+)
MSSWPTCSPRPSTSSTSLRATWALEVVIGAGHLPRSRSLSTASWPTPRHRRRLQHCRAADRGLSRWPRRVCPSSIPTSRPHCSSFLKRMPLQTASPTASSTAMSLPPTKAASVGGRLWRSSLWRYQVGPRRSSSLLLAWRLGSCHRNCGACGCRFLRPAISLTRAWAACSACNSAWLRRSAAVAPQHDGARRHLRQCVALWRRPWRRPRRLWPRTATSMCRWPLIWTTGSGRGPVADV